jgi:hypothetical protein
MPAKDHFHDIVIRALVKDGWLIIREQYPIRVESKRVWLDLSVEKAETAAAIFVEIKDFEETSSVETLRDAISQFILYRAAIKYIGIDDMTLFLAVPGAAFADILSTMLGKLAIQEAEINLFVFDPVDEVIQQWLPYTS